MKIPVRSHLFTFTHWITAAIVVGMLWCLVWMIWWGFFLLPERQAILPLFSPQTHFQGPFRAVHQVERNVTVGEYLDYMDTLAWRYDRERHYPIDEYLLVRANPWLIDSLAGTDYYLRREKGEFVYDQQSLIALRRGELLRIPDSAMVCAMMDEIGHTVLDLNIPACRLRVKIYDEIVHETLVRVGRNERKYLAMASKVVDLRTLPGVGRIIRVDRDPEYINPANNRPYYQTRRDDGRYTLLPRIPWLEPEINGRRPGQLIHPTTNVETLGRVYSNGCIGTSEADAWRLYYYAPPGTRIIIRYDLYEKDRFGHPVSYPDIYGWGRGA